MHITLDALAVGILKAGIRDRLNIKMSSYQYTSYLYDENFHTWNESLYIETEPSVQCILTSRRVEY